MFADMKTRFGMKIPDNLLQSVAGQNLLSLPQGYELMNQ